LQFVLYTVFPLLQRYCSMFFCGKVSEMTYTVSSRALNFTPTNQGSHVPKYVAHKVVEKVLYVVVKVVLCD